MEPPAPAVIVWTVIAVNAVYVALLAARVLASRGQSPGAPAAAASPIATRRVESGQATLVLVLMSMTAVVYYVALLLWLVDPRLAGPRLGADSSPGFFAGLACSVSGLALMGWTYRVFRSWRWRAEIDPGHQLMDHGPFRRIRHPIYLSFALFYAGSVLLLPYWIFLLHALASFVAYDYRARAEERVMLEAFGDAYRAYRDRTSRYLPGVY